MIEKPILYLEPGKKDIGPIIEAVKERLDKLDISSLVIASLKGGTAIKFAENLGEDIQVISVTEFNYSDNTKKKMKKNNIEFIEDSFLPIQDRKNMREGLLMFGSGVKAALEVSAIAASKDLVHDKIISVAGGKGGLDTALVVKPGKPENFSSPDPDKKMRVLEVIALPYREA